MGGRATGLPALLAAVMLVFWAEEARSRDIALFFYVWLAALALQKLGALLLRLRGARLYSRDPGEPWLLGMVPFVSTDRAAILLEPFFCFLVGAWLEARVSESLGRLISVCGFGLLFRMGIERHLERAMERDIGDAYLEQEWYAQRFNMRR